jgi:hypothetical protein
MIITPTNTSEFVVGTIIKLTEANPFQEFFVSLQSLLKKGQLVDLHIAFSPIKANSRDKRIHKHTGVPVNMTMVGAHFKISSNGRNPFEKQKAWGKNASKTKDE